jgi:hypothetical protein
MQNDNTKKQGNGDPSVQSMVDLWNWIAEAGLLPSWEIFGCLDQRSFTLDQLHEFCMIFFVGDDRRIDLPHPRKSSWVSFSDALRVLIAKEKTQWNPVKKKTMPWIDLDRLQMMYGGCKKIERRHTMASHNFYQCKSKESTNSLSSQNSTTLNNRNNESLRTSTQKHDSDFYQCKSKESTNSLHSKSSATSSNQSNERRSTQKHDSHFYQCKSKESTNSLHSQNSTTSNKRNDESRSDFYQCKSKESTNSLHE